MSVEAIKEVLDSGVCPNCQGVIDTNDTMTGYYCQSDPSHFNLVITFHGGENITATLNGEPVPQDALDQIDW